jgi:hypothetical protein
MISLGGLSSLSLAICEFREIPSYRSKVQNCLNYVSQAQETLFRVLINTCVNKLVVNTADIVFKTKSNFISIEEFSPVSGIVTVSSQD